MMRKLDADLAKQPGENFVAIRARFTAGIDELEKAANWIVENYAKDVRATSGRRRPILWLFGIVAGGWQMARAALIASQDRRWRRRSVLPGQDHHDALLRRPPDESCCRPRQQW